MLKAHFAGREPQIQEGPLHNSTCVFYDHIVFSSAIDKLNQQ